jgi:hypothetical protein
LAGTAGTALAPVRATAQLMADLCADSRLVDRRRRLGNTLARRRRTDRGATRETVRWCGVLDGLGMRVAWGRGDLGERTLGRRARATIETKVRDRLSFGVPLFECVKLQKFVQKCSKWRIGKL